MLNWIIENLATIVVCAALLVIVTLIIVKMVRDKKKGKTSCGCNCTRCSMSGSCHHGNYLSEASSSGALPIKIKKRKDV